MNNKFVIADTNLVISLLFKEETSEKIEKLIEKGIIIYVTDKVIEEVYNVIENKLKFLVDIIIFCIKECKLEKTDDFRRFFKNIQNKVIIINKKEIDIAYYKNVTLSFLDYAESKGYNSLDYLILLKLIDEFKEELLSKFKSIFWKKHLEGEIKNKKYFDLLRCLKKQFVKNNKVDKDLYVISELLYFSEVVGEKIEFLTFDKTLKKKFDQLKKDCKIKNLEIKLLEN
jgi:predicted nucleic acid-binding protein